MLKKLSTIILFCLISALAFAQTAPKQILSERDINNFIANYEKITEAIDTLGDKYDHIFAELEDADSEFDMLIKMRSIKMPPEIQNILKANGLGDNGFEKAMVIIQGIMVIFMEDEFASLAAESGADPEVAEYLQYVRDSIKPLKDSINSRDLALLNNKKAELLELLN